MRFIAFAASHRPESHNKKLVLLAQKNIEKLGHQVTFIEYESLDMPLYNDHLASTPPLPEQAHALLKHMKNSDGIIIGSPEYNWSLPGSLKNIIDWTSKVDIIGLKDKTALLLSATPSTRGGIVGLTHLRSTLEALQMHVFHKVYGLEKSHVAYDDDNDIADASRRKQLADITKDFVTYSQKITNTV